MYIKEVKNSGKGYWESLPINIETIQGKLKYFLSIRIKSFEFSNLI